jgi:type I restriction enzyme S subunit
MKNNLLIKKLGEVCDIGAGNSAPQKKDYFADGKYPFFRTSDVGAIHIGRISDSNDHLNNRGTKGLKLFKRGTILLPKSGASTFLNHRVIMNIDGYVSSHLATIKTDEKILNNNFVFYFLQKIKAQNLIQDHKYPSLNLSIIGDIEIPIPPLYEQLRIVKILDNVFEKTVKAKENINKNLQNLKDLFESYLQGIFANSKNDWKVINFEDSIERIVYTNKIQRNKFLKNGEYPIISQEKELINGRWNKKSDLFQIKKPVIIFGDHTKILKYIDFDFVLGADGVKILQPKDALYPKFFYYFLNSISLKSLGYARHYRLLKEKKVCFSESISEQKYIVAKLDALFAETKKLELIYKQKLIDLEELKKSILKKAFIGEL